MVAFVLSALLAPTEAGAQTSGALASGSSGPAVEAVQQRLTALGYDPGPADGSFGPATQYAVWAFQKVNGLPVTGAVGDAELAAFDAPAVPAMVRPDLGPDHVEVNLAAQLLTLWHNGSLELISHISSGNGEWFCVESHCRNATTPTGDFSFLWWVQGWDNGPLGAMYDPVYFATEGDFGFAIHGATDVPLYPASHGCVRIPMHTSLQFPSLVSIGEPVAVF